MAYIFQVSEQTVDDCIRHNLFGVPGTLRALCQLWNVRAGQRCYLYVPQRRRGTVLGTWRSTRARWVERFQAGGRDLLTGNPWVDATGRYRGRRRRAAERNFPYRLRVKRIGRAVGAADVALLEQAGVLDRAMFRAAAGMQGRPCVVYVTEKTADRMDAYVEQFQALGREHGLLP